MSTDEEVSDVILNAYVDGELAGDDRDWVDEQMSRDPRLRERVEELRVLKSLVHDSYTDALPSTPVRRPWAVRPAAVGIAASLAAFALGVVVTWGWFSYSGQYPGGRVASAPAVGELGESDPAVKVVFHVSRDDPQRLEDILNETKALLRAAAGDSSARVRIIASGSGLALFEKGAAAVPTRIESMQRRYGAQLVFNGCSVAYKQLNASRGEAGFELVPQVRLVDLGVLELMRRQHQGWAYLRI